MAGQHVFDDGKSKTGATARARAPILAVVFENLRRVWGASVTRP